MKINLISNINEDVLQLQDLVNEFISISPSSNKEYFIEINENNIKIQGNNIIQKVEERILLTHSLRRKRALYKLVSKLTGVQLPWGILTGVRPIKLVNRLIREYGLYITEEILSQDYCLSSEKIELTLQIAQVQKSIISAVKEKSYSLYIGIPFCETRCSYCSFPTFVKENTDENRDLYLDILLDELKESLIFFDQSKLNNIYIGGGTPTSLNERQLGRLLSEIRKIFQNWDGEFTVEAGRVDTITKDKLNIMESFGVNRISINPQSFHARTLKLVNRYHPISHMDELVEYAKTLNFIINMDLILGLPRERKEDYIYSIKRAIELNPQNITVHALAIKSKSLLKNTAVPEFRMEDGVLTEREGRLILNKYGYKPYYLYRQKQIFENLENIGYAKGDTASKYNILMMEENQEILAIGLGTVSKIKNDVLGKYYRLASEASLINYLKYGREQINKKVCKISEIKAKKNFTL